MTILDYINETNYAFSHLIDGIWQEFNQLEELDEKIKLLRIQVSSQYRQANSLMDSDDPDDIMMGAGLRWQTYFDEDKELYHRNDEYQKLEELIQTHQHSIQTLSSGLLQIGKQGISTIYGGLTSCPTGRLVGSQNLRDVIWQARNQTMHYEEGNCRPAVVAVFNQLTTDFGSQFHNYNSQNLAFEVIKVLGWRTREDFSNDIQTLV